MSKKYNLRCNIAKTLDIVGDRWTLLIISELMKGKKKFSELRESLDRIAPNILSDRLRILEEEGLISSSLYVRHPPRFDYELTDKGRGLEHVLNALAMWGNQFLDEKYYEIVHTNCDHEVSITYFCPHCERETNQIYYKAKR